MLLNFERRNDVPEEWLTHGVLISPPRHRVFLLPCKDRWKGKTPLDVFKTEFSSRPPEYYESALKLGYLRVVLQSEINKSGIPPRTPPKTGGPPKTEGPPKKKAKVDPSILCGNEQMVHEAFLVEGCVPNYSPRPHIVHRDTDFSVYYKSPGIPCYPQGPYEANSLTEEILKLQGRAPKYDDGKDLSSLIPRSPPVYLLSRLDRLTGGLVVVAETSSACAKIKKDFDQWIKGYTADVMVKSYEEFLNLCRAHEHCELVESPDGTVVICSAPISVKHHSTGKALKGEVEEGSKPSTSVFALAHEGQKCVTLLCVPVTGRTHQLRIHLSAIGAPIVDDPLYNPTCLVDVATDKRFLVVEYNSNASEEIFERLFDTKEAHLRVLNLDQPGLKELSLSEPNELIERAFYTEDSDVIDEIHRKNYSYPDLMLSKTYKRLVCAHAYLAPACIPLTAKFYITKDDVLIKDAEKDDKADDDVLTEGDDVLTAEKFVMLSKIIRKML